MGVSAALFHLSSRQLHCRKLPIHLITPCDIYLHYLSSILLWLVFLGSLVWPGAAEGKGVFEVGWSLRWNAHAMVVCGFFHSSVYLKQRFLNPWDTHLYNEYKCSPVALIKKFLDPSYVVWECCWEWVVINTRWLMLQTNLPCLGAYLCSDLVNVSWGVRAARVVGGVFGRCQLNNTCGSLQ